ncbi:hypothetical protein ETB97_003065 [Aspergillus alliaceus]|uniref:HSP20-like chaperone n=1 Tax=Petromyces alliaceus TaxID=209559 RepID=A0A5N7C773_PETAA|nr:HSP20-like chaperone [Aspergillus alliaceus]KAF5865647.1 hypothetical protein ETB97_003065 [Aspergillus burnettii]
MAFFTHFSGDFAPLFHLLDDYDVHRSCRPKQRSTPVRSFTPRFDVYESNDSYYLNGELPGANQNDIDIEFTDPHTLAIKGRVKRTYSDDTSNTSEVSEEASSANALQPTVEDEDESSNAPRANSPIESSTTQMTTQEQTKPRYKYWITERSVGEFHRVFTFPTRVDQDIVKASLRDGILSVIVPKEAAPTLKKIRVE